MMFRLVSPFNRRLLAFFCGVLMLAVRGSEGYGQQAENGEGAGSAKEDLDEGGDVGRGNFNIPFPTMGGKQFWTDYQWRFGWRIQQNAVTGHWRLLSPNNIRQAWGDREACERVLEQYAPSGSGVAPKRVVILVHGLMRTSGSMASMAKRFKTGECECISVEYASTRGSIADHAAAFRSLVERLPGEPQIDLVAHSMGNIVIRRAIYDWQQPNQDPKRVLPRLRHMAMLGPPNQGAAIARRLAKTGFFGFVTGQGGLELGPEWETIQQTLATPPFPFLIVAGKLETTIKNPLTDGEGDFVVGVEEAKLDGAKEFVEVPVLHSFLMDDAAVQEKVLAFFGDEG